MDGVNILNSSEETFVMEEDKEVVFNDLNEAWDYAYAAIAGLWLMIGVPGNLMVIVSCIIFKDMHTIPMALATNLAMSDTFVASANVATTWLTILYDRRVLLDNRGLCIITSNICGLGCVCSMASICNIAINRYVAICHNSVYSTIYNAKTVILHLASTWIAGIVITGPVFIGFRDVDHRWDRRQLFCARSNVTETGYDWVQWWELALLIPTSLAIMTFTYTRIFTRVRQSSKNLQVGNPLRIS
ncbi:alpha-1A adrenergic receptor-like [Convolutriloba macropyga]|uniref:alpha-1A adrenergic receptor-like n=1 Tax=Convolutriloba macropyga TaxID=536237 RepID=UPI003F5245CA